MTIIMICNFVLLAVQCGVVEKLPFWEVIFYSSRENTTGLNPFLKENLHFYIPRVHESGWDDTPISSMTYSKFFSSNVRKGGALFWITDYGHPMKAKIKDIWKIGPVWQTKYAAAIPKNLGVGVNFRLCSEGHFLSGCL